MRNKIPKGIKVQYASSKRWWRDWRKGYHKHWAQEDRASIRYAGMIEVQQEIKQSPLFENKVHNMKLASKHIAALQIFPNEIFSFWKTIGKATEKKGYKKGRNIINGVLQEDIGGGLCQLAGIIYHVALKTGLKIVERHPHSIDIYEEHERYTPLGADAAVSFAYKDLRLKNNLGYPIKFSFIINNKSISCRLFTEEYCFPNTIEFERNKNGMLEEVRTIITNPDGESWELDTVTYKKH